jgi:YfiR/HmsC-like
MATFRQRFAGSVGALCGIVALGFSLGGTAAEPYSEASVKAAFIYRFAAYVDWTRDPAAAQSFTIAVMGSDEIASRLESLIAERTLHDRPVRVRRVSNIKDTADAQILYVGPNHRADLKNVLQTAGGQGKLVITDEEHGLDGGSSINFLEVDRRVRFEVSVAAAQRAGLVISSELLAVAARVQGGRSWFEDQAKR